MKTVALMPMRGGSERIKNKNLRILAGSPLYEYMMTSLLRLNFIDEIYVDTDSQLIAGSVSEKFPSVRIHMRPPELGRGDTSMNEVIADFIDNYESDEIVQVHSTSPFLSAETLAAAYSRYADNINCDSMFSVSRLNARLWTKDLRPLNHDPRQLQRTQDLDPILLENSGFYIFSTSSFMSELNRIGSSPISYDLNAVESIDIDTEDDFIYAEAVALGLGLNQKRTGETM